MKESFEGAQAFEVEVEIPEWKRVLYATLADVEEGITVSAKRTKDRNSWVESLLNQMGTIGQTIDFYGREMMTPPEYDLIKGRFDAVVKEAEEYQTEFEKRKVDDELGKERIMQHLFAILG